MHEGPVEPSGATLRGKKLHRASVGCKRSPGTRLHTAFALREPQLQFKRRQIANIQQERSSTINGSILNRQDRLWMVFMESHQFFLHIILPLRMIPASTLALTSQSHHLLHLSPFHTRQGGVCIRHFPTHRWQTRHPSGVME